MNNLLNKIRIPTLLGLTIIILGMASGVYLTLRQPQTLISKASAGAKDIKVTNIEDTQASISWVTDVKTTGFVKYSQEEEREQTASDPRDNKTPSPRLLHFVNLTRLTPGTSYQYKIISGSSETLSDHFTTASFTNAKNDFKSIVGSVLDGDHFLSDGLVYLEIPGAATQSAVMKDLGNFIIPLSRIRKGDLSDIFTEKEALGKIVVFGEGQQQARAKIALNKISSPIGPLKLGQDLDLTTLQASPSAVAEFDLNSDGAINAADASIIINNFGKNPKVPRADLNGDSVVDIKDLDLIQGEIAKFGNQ